MPNHVHVLVRATTVPMAAFVKSWKGWTARQCNRLLGRSWASFWADDYWDTYMRDAEQERRTVLYIENNPVKAGLACGAREWPWSSARFRGEDAVLRLPASKQPGGARTFLSAATPG